MWCEVGDGEGGGKNGSGQVHQSARVAIGQCCNNNLSRRMESISKHIQECTTDLFDFPFMGMSFASTIQQPSPHSSLSGCEHHECFSDTQTRKSYIKTISVQMNQFLYDLLTILPRFGYPSIARCRDWMVMVGAG